MENPLAGYGLVGVVIATALQSMGLPLPGWIILAPMGVLLNEGQVTLLQVILAYIVGQTTGDGLAYGATLVASPRLNHLFPRLYTKVDHPIIRRLFAGQPWKGLLLAYFLSYFRPVVNYLAPVLKIPFPTFIFWSLVRNSIALPIYVTIVVGGIHLFLDRHSLRPWLIGALVLLLLGSAWWKTRQDRRAMGTP
ncbi:MAG TPA: VTT domain-containing protein [bacterium]|nr:VTT domain-containing protein [bacterium]